jgi:hypothetical protein
LSRKAVHNWVKKFSQGRSKVADDARPGRPVQIASGGRVESSLQDDNLRQCSDGTNVVMLVEDMSRNKCSSPPPPHF